MEKSCVYFMFANSSEMNIEIIHGSDVEEELIIQEAKDKINREMGINIDFIADKVGVNKCHGDKWYFVDFIENITS